MVSPKIHYQGKKATCWAYAISTMLRRSLKLFIKQLDKKKYNIKAAEDKLDHEDHHRQLRNEIITGPIPKNLSEDFTDLKDEDHLNHTHYVQLACERLKNPTAFDDIGILMLDSIREIFDILDIQHESIRCNIEKYNLEKDIKKLETEMKRKSFVVTVANKILWSDPLQKGAHSMAATAIIPDQTKGRMLQLKNSYADYPDQPDVCYLPCDSLKDEVKKNLNFFHINFELTRDRKRPFRDPSDAGPDEFIKMKKK